jgi:mannose-1-phosphate guanylyltransferase
MRKTRTGGPASDADTTPPPVLRRAALLVLTATKDIRSSPRNGGHRRDDSQITRQRSGWPDQQADPTSSPLYFLSAPQLSRRRLSGTPLFIVHAAPEFLLRGLPASRHAATEVCVNARSDVDAVILVGGQGTRLRPLSLTTAKPLLPMAGVPFIDHLLTRIRAAGIEHVVLGTSYKAETFADHLGDGSAFGLDIEYVVEDTPLGTGGAIRNVADRLRGRTAVVFNGDILSGVDLGALIDHHEERSADVTLHLVKVEDPRPFGCVPTDHDGRVLAFLEKTDDPPTDQINAGCYVFRRSVLETIPARRVVSVERETFPGLLADGVRIVGYVDSSYWLDLGTPAAFVRGSADLVSGIAPTHALPGRPGDALLLAGATCAEGAVLTGGSTLGRDAHVGSGAVVDTSVIFDGGVIGAEARVVRSVVGAGARIGAGSVICDAVIGDGAEIGAECEVSHGARVWPGVRLPDRGLRFSPDA